MSSRFVRACPLARLPSLLNANRKCSSFLFLARVLEGNWSANKHRPPKRKRFMCIVNTISCVASISRCSQITPLRPFIIKLPVVSKMDQYLPIVPYLQAVIRSKSVDVCWRNTIVKVRVELGNQTLVGLESLGEALAFGVLRSNWMTYMLENVAEICR